MGRQFYLKIPTLYFCLKIEIYAGGFLYIDSNKDNNECTSTSTSDSTLNALSPYVNSTDELAYFSQPGGWSGNFIFKVDDTATEVGLKHLEIDPITKTFYIELRIAGCIAPSASPSLEPSSTPSSKPTLMPSATPSAIPSTIPSGNPSSIPSYNPSSPPTSVPSLEPSSSPSVVPSEMESMQPSLLPSGTPTHMPSSYPSEMPSAAPSKEHSAGPSMEPKCTTEEVEGKTFFINISTFGTICLKMEFFPGGLIYVDPKNTNCSRDTTDPSSYQAITAFVGSNGDSILFEANHSLNAFYSGEFDFVLQGSDVFVTFLTIDHMRRTFRGRITLPSCIAPSNIPSIVPSFLPTKIPSIHPTDLPTTVPSTSPTNIPSQVPSTIHSDLPSVIPSEAPTPVCNVANIGYIGDGFCDDDLPNYYTEKCNWDGGDCDLLNATYPLCPGPYAWIGDCVCDPSLNTTACGFDDGDCLASGPDNCELKQGKKEKSKKKS